MLRIKEGLETIILVSGFAITSIGFGFHGYKTYPEKPLVLASFDDSISYGIEKFDRIHSSPFLQNHQKEKDLNNLRLELGQIHRNRREFLKEDDGREYAESRYRALFEFVYSGVMGIVALGILSNYISTRRKK